MKVTRIFSELHANALSRPVRLAIEAGLFKPGATFFDYGCGHGVDVKRIAERGYASGGWDPFYFPEAELAAADVVNFGYVLNVVEREEERRAALLKAWSLAKEVLIVAAQVLIGEPGKGHLAYNDGLITNRNTFQKYYEQEELKSYIDSALSVDAAPAGLGVYFVFRDEAQAQAFRASRFRSRATTPRVKAQLRSFDNYRELLEPLMQFISDRGRLPVSGETANEDAILSEFRSFARAFAVIRRATDGAEWDKIIERRRQDMLVYIALGRFGRRPKFTDLPPAIQHDLKAFFGTYTRACETADALLFSLGQPGVIAAACRASRTGKFVGNALYVHVSALDTLDTILRLYEGCASRAFGRLDEATIIKFRADKPKISYLYYPDFDTDPHPALRSSMQADLQGLYVGYRDYSAAANPPILHRKETFVAPNYPLYRKFARLTAQQEKWGLLDDAASIGTRDGWNRRLLEHGAALRGHRLVHNPDFENQTGNGKDVQSVSS
jgi:DNA phosphorothioation-associated putative methyltransferase